MAGFTSLIPIVDAKDIMYSIPETIGAEYSKGNSLVDPKSTATANIVAVNVSKPWMA